MPCDTPYLLAAIFAALIVALLLALVRSIRGPRL